MAAEQQVQLTDLEPIQLQEVKKQLDQELDHLTTSYQQLKQAQAKFRSCLSDLGELTPSAKGKEVLVPLTSSLYVPGRLADTEMVVVDIGTGYYVRKKRSEAREHYTAKSASIQGNLETLQNTIERKQENVQTVMQVLQMKLQGGRGGGGGK
ncbi:Prefoldin subunit-domain-containing protein [Dioszegia hungarica]|uniref:Prefoldin subunit-domain-containing protein n=1 Tax=Dioszegia hungarica TaxID=4972 RepID=A0AA38LVZ7_9TREE|nr:Prefoldin subunit-domain-containing protein [Dioszegia hungarica]KAI9635986.1 Prefoldin subunit-domain-containing protein [Dioszegia hungarica]